jgi:hypothetical protein
MCRHCQSLSCTNTPPAHMEGGDEGESEDRADPEDAHQCEYNDHDDVDDDNNDEDTMEIVASDRMTNDDPVASSSKKRQYSDDE